MISKKEVENISKLARLELTEKEIENMQKDLSEIIDYFNSLKNIKEKTQVSKIISRDVLRKDVAFPQTQETIKRLIDAAPDKRGDHVKVKTIL